MARSVPSFVVRLRTTVRWFMVQMKLWRYRFLFHTLHLRVKVNVNTCRRSCFPSSTCGSRICTRGLALFAFRSRLSPTCQWRRQQKVNDPHRFVGKVVAVAALRRPFAFLLGGRCFLGVIASVFLVLPRLCFESHEEGLSAPFMLLPRLLQVLVVADFLKEAINHSQQASKRDFRDIGHRTYF